MDMQSYKAAIIDDEEDAREIIALLLSQYFPDIEVIDKLGSIQAATRSIPAHDPDIIFLDIEMGDGTGFDLLERLPGFNGIIIFITAFDNYAIKAIKASASDYILKPLNRDEFRQAVNKALGKLELRPAEQDYAAMLQVQAGEVRKIGIPNLTGYSFVEVDTIVRCEADGNYCVVYFTKNPKVLVSKPLSHFENDLKKFGFMRIHHKHLVNLHHVINYSKGKGGGYITMSDNAQLEVSARKKHALLKILGQGG